jgi:hypothetical protein
MMNPSRAGFGSTTVVNAAQEEKAAQEEHIATSTGR